LEINKAVLLIYSAKVMADKATLSVSARTFA